MTDAWVTIASDCLTAAINPFGAELSSLQDAAGRELMTDADPAFWTGRAPILFPVIGTTNGGVVRVEGRDYPMAKHGFARRSRFAVAAAEPSRAIFALEDNAETRAAYPFAFRLELSFALDGATLAVEARIANCGAIEMPAQFGFHPAFAWPLPYGLPRAEHRIAFAADEDQQLRRVQPDGLIDPEPRPSPLHGRELVLCDELFTDDALVWDPVRSQQVGYGAASGPQLTVAFPDTPRLGIWTKPGAHYVCIEPWHGIADPAGFTGELRDKPGVFLVPPGGSQRIGMRVTLTE
ncbi:aldose 1-epimerase family protein [Sphingomonas sp.]|uniref:aldose 1-epimerase family protein n=1 Tax=Sphingomonas sp. TaxID=28214 RepID=UPI003CC55199